MDRFYGFMGKVYDKAVETSKTVATKASEIYHDEAVRQSAKEIGKKMLDTSKEVGSKILTETKSITQTVSANVREKGVVDYSKELGAMALDKTVEVGNQVFDFTISTAEEVKQQTQEKGVVNYTKELAGKGVGIVKQGYNDTVELVKNQKMKSQTANLSPENTVCLEGNQGERVVIESGINPHEIEEERKEATPDDGNFRSEQI